MWLLDRGYDYEAWQVLERMALINGKQLEDMALVSYHHEASASCSDLLAHRGALVSLGLIWCLGLFGYYGASLGSALIFGSASDYGELLFAALGEIVGVTAAMALSWRLQGVHLQVRRRGGRCWKVESS